MRQTRKTLSSQYRHPSSITAKPFFEKRGYIVIKEQTVERFGVELRNYVMEKPAL